MQPKKRISLHIEPILAAILFLVGCANVNQLPPSVTAPQPLSQDYGMPPKYMCSYSQLGDEENGGFYKDDGPLALPLGIDEVPEPIPQDEPLHRYANRVYSVLGQTFYPITTRGSYTGQGIASWYGRKFHARKTASGEIYDMFQVTAAHPTLPIPSYARVHNLENGRSIVVRINDRGPFLKGREIDLSFLAACRLGYAVRGSAQVKVVSLDPSNELSGFYQQQQDPIAKLIEKSIEIEANHPLPPLAEQTTMTSNNTY